MSKHTAWDTVPTYLEENGEQKVFLQNPNNEVYEDNPMTRERLNKIEPLYNEARLYQIGKKIKVDFPPKTGTTKFERKTSIVNPV